MEMWPLDEDPRLGAVLMVGVGVNLAVALRRDVSYAIVLLCHSHWPVGCD